MMATNVSSADNEGSITTHGTGANGMLAEYNAFASNSGSILTEGVGAYGMRAYGISSADNSGSITTSGDNSFGMAAENGSYAVNSGTIVTSGDNSYGMFAYDHSTALNTSSESIETFGDGSHGMVADSFSAVTNTGSVTTHGDGAHGMVAVGSSTADNSGTVTTYGDNSVGMVVSQNSTGTNSGTLTTRGAGADAAYVEYGSTFTNTGTLDSLQGYAVRATDFSQVWLLDGTVLAGSHTLRGDMTSSLDVVMNDLDTLSVSPDISAQVVGFGYFTKAGNGWMTLEDGSWAWNTHLAAGTLEIAEGTQFWTGTYLQDEGSNLYMYADPYVVPLVVSDDADISGTVTIDGSRVYLPGVYTYIDAGSYVDNFDTAFVNMDPLYDPYQPVWFSEGDRELYKGMIGYSFSEQALGMVAAIHDWSLLRWVMANHMADIADGLVDLEDGSRHFHFQGLYGKTERDPAGDSAAGFDATQSGVSFGFDQKLDGQTAWGLYAGYTTNDLDITHVEPAAFDGEDQETWHFGGYVSYRTGNWILTDALTYRTTDHESFRRQINENATAKFDSWSITNDFRAGYMVKEIDENSSWQIVPEVGFNYGTINRDAYEEENGFEYGDFDATVWEGVLGVRFRGEYAREDGSKWVPSVRVSWVHVLSGDDITLTQTWYGDTHEYTEILDDDYFVVDFGVSLYTAGDTEISLNYNGRFGENSDFHGAWLRFRMGF